MDSTTQTANVPAQIQAEAKQRALAILAQEPGCISYVRPEDLETASIFIPVVSIIKPTADDFYPPIPGVGIMGKPQLVNLIREKAGINITRQETVKRGEYTWVTSGAGEKRQPDGSMLTDMASYEFDAEKRAELDAINQPDKYGSAIGKRKHVLELCKFGEQRSVTGFQHALIHKLAHIARSFKTPDELMRGMKILRIDRNVNGILADPQMRTAAIDRMLGASETVYGPKQLEAPIPHTVDVETQEVIEPAATEKGQADLFDDAPPPAGEKSETDKLREILESYRPQIKSSPKATKLLDDMMAKKDATKEELNGAIDRFVAYVQKTGNGGAK
jgi:hypothetical protein